MATALKLVGLLIVAAVITVIIGNLSILSKAPAHDTALKILSHRGVHQTFHTENLTNQTCTATRIFQPTHAYIENTLPSIKAAFDYGADMVEIDARRTADNKFAVFHDDRLECRTNGAGHISSHTMAELRQLDIGYGYTADNGASYPLRGKGAGMMPSLDEVLRAFPKGAFQINIKSNNSADADQLIAFLEDAHISLNSQTRLWSGPRFAKRWRTLNTQTKIATKPETKACAKSYLLTGWTGHVPEVCKNFGLVVPQDLTWLYWGWPRKTVVRFRHQSAPVFLMGALNGVNPGIDTPEQVEAIPDNFRGWIVTNRIEVIGPALKQN